MGRGERGGEVGDEGVGEGRGERRSGERGEGRQRSTLLSHSSKAQGWSLVVEKFRLLFVVEMNNFPPHFRARST